MQKFVTDNSGLRYHLQVIEDADDLFWIELWRKGEWVGGAKYQIDPSNIIIASDIYIRDDSDPRGNRPVIRDYSNLSPKFRKSIIVTTPRSKKDIKNYRHRELGTRLLNLLIEHAKYRNVRRIYGSIMKDDIAGTPGLIEWYERHGFQRCGPYSGCIGNAAAWIFMDLT